MKSGLEETDPHVLLLVVRSVVYRCWGFPGISLGSLFGDYSAQRAAACSSVPRCSTQRAPSGVCSFFQNGAWVLR